MSILFINTEKIFYFTLYICIASRLPWGLKDLCFAEFIFEPALIAVVFPNHLDLPSRRHHPDRRECPAYLLSSHATRRGLLLCVVITVLRPLLQCCLPRGDLNTILRYAFT